MVCHTQLILVYLLKLIINDLKTVKTYARYLQIRLFFPLTTFSMEAMSSRELAAHKTGAKINIPCLVENKTLKLRKLKDL